VAFCGLSGEVFSRDSSKTASGINRFFLTEKPVGVNRPLIKTATADPHPGPLSHPDCGEVNGRPRGPPRAGQGGLAHPPRRQTPAWCQKTVFFEPNQFLNCPVYPPPPEKSRVLMDPPPSALKFERGHVPLWFFGWLARHLGPIQFLLGLFPFCPYLKLAPATSIRCKTSSLTHVNKRKHRLPVVFFSPTFAHLLFVPHRPRDSPPRSIFPLLTFHDPPPFF